MENKTMRKGQIALGQAASLIIILLVVALTIGVGAKTISSIQDTQKLTGTQVNNTFTVTAVNTSNTLTSPRIYVGSEKVIALNSSLKNETGVIVTNVTLALVKGADGTGNYTILYNDGTIAITSPGLNFSRILVNYTYEVYGNDFNASERGNSGLLNFSNFQSTIGVLIAAVILIGLVTTALLFGKLG